MAKAIASFQRTLISGHSKFDQYRQGQATLSDAEERGRILFFGEKAECFHCHGSFNLNDQVVHAGSRPGFVETPFHNTGLYNIDGKGAFPAPNRGVFESRLEAQRHGQVPRAQPAQCRGDGALYARRYRSAPWPGCSTSMRQAVGTSPRGPFAGDGRTNPFKSGLVTLIRLSEQDKADLIAFLQTLTDHEFLNNPAIADPFATK